MLIDLVGRSVGRRGRNLLKFIARKIGEKEFTFWECARSPMKTAANSKFMTLFGVHNCRRRAELLASLRPSRILNTYNADTDSRVVVPLVVRWLIRPVAVGRRTHSILSLFLRTRR